MPTKRFLNLPKAKIISLNKIFGLSRFFLEIAWSWIKLACGETLDNCREWIRIFASDCPCRIKAQFKRIALTKKSWSAAIVNSPSLVLADEPTGNLDSENSDIVYDILSDLAVKENLSLLIVTHNKDLASKCDRVIEMRDGLVINSGLSPWLPCKLRWSLPIECWQNL